MTKNQALRFLEQNRGKRFFAGVSFKKPHFPFLVHRISQALPVVAKGGNKHQPGISDPGNSEIVEHRLQRAIEGSSAADRPPDAN